MPSLRIILLCMGAAVVYGVCLDQVTARVCVEYFTVGHARLFPTDSPTLLALAWGTAATWWVGLIFGVVAALVSRAGSWPKLEAAHLLRPIACLLVVMAVASLLAGITGYQLAKTSGMVLPEPLGSRVPKDRHHLMFADSMAHLGAYMAGILGGLIVLVRVLVQRRRMARAARAASDGTAPAAPPNEHWAFVVSRWIARMISIPLFGLVAILAFGDGVPNPLTASLRENLLGAAVLLMVFGLVLTWKWEGLGGLLVLGGLVLFAMADTFLLPIVVAPWVVLGAAYLVCWLGKRWGSRVAPASPDKIDLPASSDRSTS